MTVASPSVYYNSYKVQLGVTCLDSTATMRAVLAVCFRILQCCCLLFSYLFVGLFGRTLHKKGGRCARGLLPLSPLTLPWCLLIHYCFGTTELNINCGV